MWNNGPSEKVFTLQLTEGSVEHKVLELVLTSDILTSLKIGGIWKKKDWWGPAGSLTPLKNHAKLILICSYIILYTYYETIIFEEKIGCSEPTLPNNSFLEHPQSLRLRIPKRFVSRWEFLSIPSSQVDRGSGWGIFESGSVATDLIWLDLAGLDSWHFPWPFCWPLFLCSVLQVRILVRDREGGLLLRESGLIYDGDWLMYTFADALCQGFIKLFLILLYK